MTIYHNKPATAHPVPHAVNRLRTVNDTKAALGCGTTKLYEIIADGFLDARKLGRRTLITEASITAYLDSLPKANITTGRRNVA